MVIIFFYLRCISRDVYMLVQPFIFNLDIGNA